MHILMASLLITSYINNDWHADVLVTLRWFDIAHRARLSFCTHRQLRPASSYKLLFRAVSIQPLMSRKCFAAGSVHEFLCGQL